MTEPLADGLGGVLSAQALKRALLLARERDVVVLGPGLGTDPGTREFVKTFVPQCPVPLVVDADGLNALSGAGTTTGPLELIRRPQPTVVTPHPGEMARLASLDTAVVQKRRARDRARFRERLGRGRGAQGTTHGHRREGRPGGREPHREPRHGERRLGRRPGRRDRRLAVLVTMRGRRRLRAPTCTAWPGIALVARTGESGVLASDLADALPEAIRWLAGDPSEEKGHH